MPCLFLFQFQLISISEFKTRQQQREQNFGSWVTSTLIWNLNLTYHFHLTCWWPLQHPALLRWYFCLQEFYYRQVYIIHFLKSCIKIRWNHWDLFNICFQFCLLMIVFLQEENLYIELYMSTLILSEKDSKQIVLISDSKINT